jgi:hypothetical protein
MMAGLVYIAGPFVGCWYNHYRFNRYVRFRIDMSSCGGGLRGKSVRVYIEVPPANHIGTPADPLIRISVGSFSNRLEEAYVEEGGGAPSQGSRTS